MTQFIGVSFGVSDHKLCVIATSSGYAVADSSGLTSQTALAFLWSIAYLPEFKQTKDKPVLVMYDTSMEVELLLRDLTPAQKDILFGLYRTKEDKNKDLPIFDNTTDQYKGIAECFGFRVSQLAGKTLRLKPMGSKRAMLGFYDVSSYFAGSEVNEAVRDYLNDTAPAKIKKVDLALWQEGMIDQLIKRCESEAKLIERLAEKVERTIEPLNINMRQWYGPSAIAARCLHKWQARRQAKRLNEKNSASELLKAIDCAYFGGRVEAIKLGYVESVNTFDLNSAYAYATTLLAQFVKPLRFTRKYYDLESAPFSCWLAEYELPDETILGVLPTRSPQGGISFRKRGFGYFWQPEIDYLAKRYPGSFRIKWGYMGPEYKQVTFSGAINRMYDYRNELKAQGDNGEKIIKLALANLYGKFAQNTGAAHFQCRSWAGWITSFVRRLLLDAVTGIEDSVICFCQDAVHLEQAESQRVVIGNGLGEWKQERYHSGFYVAPGIYDLYDQAVSVKSATRGANHGLDFDKIASDLSRCQVTELERTFFCGWTMACQHELTYQHQYLSEVAEVLKLIPSRLRARNYQTNFNWRTENKTSIISNAFSGQLSARYYPQDHQTALRLRVKDRVWE